MAGTIHNQWIYELVKILAKHKKISFDQSTHVYCSEIVKRKNRKIDKHASSLWHMI